LPVACVAAQEHFWRASNSSQPTWKWNTFADIVSPFLEFPDENLTVLIREQVVQEEIQVEMKHVYFYGYTATKFVIQ